MEAGMVDYARRLDSIRSIMVKHDLDACILFGIETQEYISGSYQHGAPTAVLVPVEKDPVMITHAYELSRAKHESWLKDIRSFTMYGYERPVRGFLDTISDVTNEYGLNKARIGIEEDTVTIATYNSLKKLLLGAKFEDCSSVITEAIMVPSKEEIKILRSVAEIGDVGALTAMKLIEPGITELDVAGEIDRALYRAGAHHLWFPTCVGSGYRSCFVVPYATEKIIQSGDMVLIDYGWVYRGFHGDFATSFALGKPTKEQEALMGAVIKVTNSAIERIKPGVTGEEIDRSNRNMLKELGYEEYMLASSGRNINIKHHTEPWLRRGSKYELKEGMVLITGVTIQKPGVGGMRLDNMVLVREDGCESLTKMPKEVSSLLLEG